MTFNPNKRLDPSQVQDRRGRRSMGRTVAVGGGGLGLVLLIASLVFGVDLTGLTDYGDSGYSSQDYYGDGYEEDTSDLTTECQTGADANERQDCRIVGFVNSIQTFWEDELADYGVDYIPADTILFSGSTQGACGYASAASGPFYCPRDGMVYLDLSFFDTLENEFGARGGPFAEAYVLSHEYGHHIQNILGVLETNRSQSMSVFTELQADCLSGIWFNHAVETGYIAPLTNEEISQALNAAASVGDDHIQRQTQGYIVPEAWTHGSSEQRYAAFRDGLASGDLNTCNSPGWTE